MIKRKHLKNMMATLFSVLILISTIAVSFAWFINNRDVGIHSNDNIVISTGKRLEIGIEGPDGESEKWGTSIAVGTGERVCPDISGDGVNFYFPTTLTSDDEPTLDIVKNFKYINTLDNKYDYYICVRLKLRTNTPMDVYLSNTSKIEGENMDRNDDLSKTVPSGCIAGALRVGFLEEMSVTDEHGQTVAEQELKAIWIPNDKYELKPHESGEGLSFSATGTREEAYSYLKPNNDVFNSSTEYMEQVNWGLDDYASGKIMVGNDCLSSNNDEILNTNGSTPLLSFKCEDGVIEEKTLVICIWVEGTDREAHTNLNGGKINYGLDFLGITKEEYTEDELIAFNSVKVDEDGFYTLSDNDERISYDNSLPLDYSFNGIDWLEYDPNDNIEELLADKENICIRISESDTKKPSEYRLVEIK